MRLRAASVVCSLIAVLAAACGGDDEPTPEDTALASEQFREAAIAGLKEAGLDAGARFDLNVSAFEGPNRVDLALDDAFAAYQEDPDRKDELIAGVVAEAEEGLATGISDKSFEDVEADLMPLLQARFDLRQYGFDPVRTDIPGNLAVVYVVDGDGGFTVVEPDDLERWGMTVEEVDEVALDNLLKQTNENEELVCEPSGDLELCGWSSSDGYDATRMVVPGLRQQIVEQYGGSAVYAVPMDNVFVALPLELLEQNESAELLRTKVQRDFQTADNPVSPDLFVERKGKLALFQ